MSSGNTDMNSILSELILTVLGCLVIYGFGYLIGYQVGKFKGVDSQIDYIEKMRQNYERQIKKYRDIIDNDGEWWKLK